MLTHVSSWQPRLLLARAEREQARTEDAALRTATARTLMARFRPRGLRPGTEDYKRKRRGWLNQQRALAEANAARASAVRVEAARS